MKEVSDKLRDFATFVENKKSTLPNYRDPLAEFVSFLDKLVDKMRDVENLADKVDFAEEGATIAIMNRISDMVMGIEDSYHNIKPLEENLNELYHSLLNAAIDIEQKDLTAEEVE